MGVDFGTIIFRGWKMTPEQKERFNEVTAYEYEDSFTYPSYYNEPDAVYNPPFFGDHVDGLDCGDWLDVEEYPGAILDARFVYRENGICDNIMPIHLALITLGETELAAIFDEPPHLYVISQVS